jgi:protein-S-isoprenylcysteine O-methyltransferase Ste14
MWLDRAQMLLAAIGVILGGVMVAFGVTASSWPGLLLIIVGVVVCGNGIWFVVDAKRRMERRHDGQGRRGSTRARIQ